jgi:hypothetical protein
MKIFSLIFVVALVALLAAGSGRADDVKKPRPYVLKTCPVSDEKLGGDMGDPYVFIYGKTKDNPGREIKFCCKSCLKDFNKEPAKYLKKIDEQEAKAKAKTKS